MNYSIQKDIVLQNNKFADKILSNPKMKSKDYQIVKDYATEIRISNKGLKPLDFDPEKATIKEIKKLLKGKNFKKYNVRIYLPAFVSMNEKLKDFNCLKSGDFLNFRHMFGYAKYIIETCLDIIETCPVIDIYRVETENHIGPYVNNINAKIPYFMKHSNKTTHPNLNNDKDLTKLLIASKEQIQEHFRFGFTSVEQLTDWFESEYFDFLNHHGFKVYKYSIPEVYVGKSEKQAIFKYENAQSCEEYGSFNPEHPNFILDM